MIVFNVAIVGWWAAHGSRYQGRKRWLLFRSVRMKVFSLSLGFLSIKYA